MIFEERILGVAQGLTSLALERDASLRVELQKLSGAVLRVTSNRPYISFFLILCDDSIAFVLEYEGDISGVIDCDALRFFRALYGPGFLSSESLSECLAVEHEPGISEFLVKLVHAWDLVSLLQTLCVDFLPFLHPQDELAAELRQFQRQVNVQLLKMNELQAQHLEIVRGQSQALDQLKQELVWLRYLVAFLGLVVLGLGSGGLWLGYSML